MFYVVNTPCTNISASSINLKDGISNNGKGKFKQLFFNVANLVRNETFFATKKFDQIKETCEKAKLKNNFHCKRNIEKVLIYVGNNNENNKDINDPIYVQKIQRKIKMVVMLLLE